MTNNIFPIGGPIRAELEQAQAAFKTTTIADTSTLVRLRTKKTRRSVQDKDARQTLAVATGTDEKDWNVSKKLFAKSARFAAVNTAIYLVDKFVKKHTSPWLDDGFRALPNAEYMNFTQSVRPLIQDVEAKVLDFQQHYHAEVQADLSRPGCTAKFDDYPPTAPDIRVELTFMPIPTTEDFRIPASDTDQQRYAAELERAMEIGRNDIFRRTLEPLSRLAERLSEFTGEKGKRWHQSVVDEIFDEVSAMEALNTGNDERVTELLSSAQLALAPFAGNSALKDSQHSRNVARASIDEILSKFS